MEWKHIQDAYPINQSKIWLNNCGTTPCSNLHIQRMQDFFQEYSLHGIFAPNFSYSKIRREILMHLSSLLDCDSNDLALIHNTSEGMNFFVRGLDWGEGDEIFLLENEYPSNYYPWERCIQLGAKIHFIPMSASPQEYAEKIERLLGDPLNLEDAPGGRRRVLSVSPVHWCTGVRLPMDRIAEICRERNVWLVLDGAQAMGHVPLKLKAWNVRFMSGSAWKWLLGPIGLGVVYVSPECLVSLDPVFKGTQSVPNEMEYLPYRHNFKPTTERYEYSTSSFADWVYFHTSLELLSSVGWGRVQNRILELAEYLRMRCREKGWDYGAIGEMIGTSSPHDPGQESYGGSGIVSLKIVGPGISAESVRDALASKGIVTAARLGRLRLSPHIYNREEQLDNLVQSLEEHL